MLKRAFYFSPPRLPPATAGWGVKNKRAICPAIVKTIKDLNKSEYDKYEKELFKLEDESVKRIIELYSQFKVWNKYLSKTVLEMRIDEYRDFRRILLCELPMYPMVYRSSLGID